MAFVAGVLSSSLVLIVDLHVPLGVAVGVVYVIPLLAALWARAAWQVWALASLATAFTLAKLVPWADSVAPFEHVLVNRSISVAAIWVVAALLAAARAQREREADAEARRQSLVRAAVEGMPDAVLAVGAAGRVELANAAAGALFGREPCELVGERFCALLAGASSTPRPATAADWEAHLQRFLAKGAACLELRMPRAVGEHAVVECSARSGFEAAGLAIVSLRDVTAARRELERAHARQKLESLGQLAGSVAHDFNNMLTAILGFGELARNALPGDSPLREDLDVVVGVARDAAQMTAQLLAFSRNRPSAPRTIDIAPKLLEVGRLVTRIIGEHIETQLRVEPGLWPVEIDSSQLEQIVLNLALNARDAMRDGGRLVITAENAPGDGAPAGEGPRRRGDLVRITVADSGVGMSPEVASRVFEPFFTTKGPGVGTGLGLAGVYGIVEQAGGTIALETAEGLGTTFTLSFPRSRVPVEAAPAATPIVRGSDERVLLVDDDPQIRELFSRILREGGYDVVEAADGVEALGLVLERGSSSFAAVIMDLVMPRLGGACLAQRLSVIAPELPLVFVSGYSPTGVLTVAGISAVLPKPVEPATLLAAVGSAVASWAPRKEAMPTG